MKKIVILLFILIAFNVYSQNNTDSIKAVKLKEVNINSERYFKSKIRATQKIESVSKSEIEFQNFQNTADLLQNSGSLAVQKSQQGGGSPIIRGFEANRILLLIDGVRMNNLIYRAGHLQNCITIDENMIEQVDVLFGASSTNFGSDALGGAVNFKTKQALLLSENNNKKFSGNAITRYSSANNETSGHIDFNFASKKWASLTTISYNNFDDLKMGSKKNGNNSYFGERPYYVITEKNTDYLVLNSNKLVQKFSGYSQVNAMQKIVFNPNTTTQHGFNIQFSTTSDIPRYDRLTDPSSTGLKFARWDYGPQKRFLTGYKLNKQKVFLNSDLSLGVNYQNIEESRITRRFNSDETKTQIEKVSVYSVNADFKTKLGKGDLLYGSEIFVDQLQSKATFLNRITNIETLADTRYPNGDNYTIRTDIFATYNLPLNDKTYYNIGARAGHVSLKSTIADNSIFSLPFDVIKQSNFTYSGTTGIVSNNKNSRISANISSGFRVPNIDDLSKIFESGAGNLIVPNTNLKPEKTITADFNITLFDNKTFQFEHNFYFTRLFDAIVTAPFLFNGSNTIIYDGSISNVFANQNLGKANISGINSSLKINFSKSFTFYGNFNYANGRIINNSGNNSPLDHIPPFYGKVGLKFQNKYISTDFYMLYNGKKSIKDYYLNGEDNEQYAPENGMPAWKTFNCKTSLIINKYGTIFAGIDNIFDIQYRTFASGINAPGRNIYLGLKYSLLK